MTDEVRPEPVADVERPGLLLHPRHARLRTEAAVADQPAVVLDRVVREAGRDAARDVVGGVAPLVPPLRDLPDVGVGEAPDLHSSASGKLRCTRGGTRKFCRCVVWRMELNPWLRSRGGSAILPSGSTPSIARRLRRKSSPVGLNTTKWTPAAGETPISSGRIDHENGLSSVLKSARTGIAEPLM